ncbi:hypothetical protein [Altererythrobacter aquiaggeris]|uniref:hypothetical protein n=1 Tax=Aestuarierythrobacter aquiaggeris TaxID=1898396 RepID=UPI0030173A9E
MDQPTAGIGQIANVGPASITPMGVLEDSRCPEGVQCVHAGTVRIMAEVAAGWDTDRAEMKLAKPVEVIGGTVTLVAADPAPRSGGQVAEVDYRFTFAFKAEK